MTKIDIVSGFFNNNIQIILHKAPAKENIMAERLANVNDTSITLIKDILIAAFSSITYKATMTTRLASPIFMPGTAKGMGIRLSI